MKRMLLTVLGVAFVCMMATNAGAVMNNNGKYALHYAGPHNQKLNTCDFVLTNCGLDLVTSVAGAGRYDIYAIAVDVNGLTGARFGLHCEVLTGGLFLYGWTSCADLELPTPLWPGCGEGNAVTWATEQMGPHVTMGILDVLVYAGTNAKMCLGADPRVGFAEFCDGSEPYPLCNSTTNPAAFGCVGFGRLGYNPCDQVPVENSSWGAIKALYR